MTTQVDSIPDVRRDGLGFSVGRGYIDFWFRGDVRVLGDFLRWEYDESDGVWKARYILKKSLTEGSLMDDRISDYVDELELEGIIVEYDYVTGEYVICIPVDYDYMNSAVLSDFCSVLGCEVSELSFEYDESRDMMCARVYYDMASDIGDGYEDDEDEYEDDEDEYEDEYEDGEDEYEDGEDEYGEEYGMYESEGLDLIDVSVLDGLSDEGIYVDFDEDEGMVYVAAEVGRWDIERLNSHPGLLGLLNSLGVVLSDVAWEEVESDGEVFLMTAFEVS